MAHAWRLGTWMQKHVPLQPSKREKLGARTCTVQIYESPSSDLLCLKPSCTIHTPSPKISMVQSEQRFQRSRSSPSTPSFMLCLPLEGFGNWICRILRPAMNSKNTTTNTMWCAVTAEGAKTCRARWGEHLGYRTRHSAI